MGMIGRILGLGTAARQIGGVVSDVAEVFVGNRAERDAADQERFGKVLAQYGEEFAHPVSGWFDQMVNGMNRLPRPMMALGTLGLFSYSMTDPSGFAARMQGLAYVPDPLWWLLGAVVSFYFGARELHHYRERKLVLPTPPEAAAPRSGAGAAKPLAAPRPVVRRVAAPAEADAANAASRPRVTTKAEDPTFNAAFEEWRMRSA
jgi:hypothetical protein